jgi:hypothetical protein
MATRRVERRETNKTVRTGVALGLSLGAFKKTVNGDVLENGETTNFLLLCIEIKFISRYWS